MDEHTFQLLREDAEKALSEARLLDALNAIEGQLTEGGNWQLQSELAELKSSYGMLLDCMARGMEDPDRRSLLNRFMRQADELESRVYREYLLRNSSSLYASTWRTLEKLPQPSSLIELRHTGCSYRHLFDCVWTSPLWSAAEAEAASDILSSETFSVSDKCVLLSATMLSALTFFDSEKLKFLTDNIRHPNISLRVRALTGAILVIIAHQARCLRYKLLEDTCIHQLPEDEDLRSDMLLLQMQLLMSLETKKIEKSLREDIIPEVMKNIPRPRNGKPMTLEEMKEHFSEADINPEWEKDGRASRLGKKMRELAEMQQRGADVFMGSFSMMKQKFPFFSIAANWFCPFSPEHPEIKSIVSGNNFIKAMLAGHSLCDADKYSFCLMLSTMPATQADLLRSGMQDGMEQFPDAEPLSRRDEMRRELRNYVQSIYRFFKLFPHAKSLDDPFRNNLLFTDYNCFRSLLSDTESLLALADFAFEEKSFAHVLRIYNWLPIEEYTAEIWQKIGYCHRCQGNLFAAADAYEHANLLRSDSAWTLRQLADCHYLLGDIHQALAVYEELLVLTPENTVLLLRIGECLMRLKQYERALQLLFKADYLHPDHLPTLRAIAWCSLCAGNREQAQRYYDKLLAQTNEIQPTDITNAAHAAWIRGEIATAVGLYRRALSLTESDFAPVDFFTTEDVELLCAMGKTEEDLRLMRDILNKR